MNGVKGLAVAAVLMGSAVVLAAPAWADDFSGKYVYTSPASAHEPPITTTWTVTPCGPRCAHVVSASGLTNADAHLIGGQWVLERYSDTAFFCSDGTKAPGTIRYTFDPKTLRGQNAVDPAPACGMAMTNSNPNLFTLTKVGSGGTGSPMVHD
jgi:hypothetical protein